MASALLDAALMPTNDAPSLLRPLLLAIIPITLALACGDAPVESTAATGQALGGIPYQTIVYPETGITSGVDAISQPSLVSLPTEVFWADASGHLQWKHFDDKFGWQPARVAPTGSVFVVGKPSAVVTDVNEWRVFVEGSDGSFWYVDYLGYDWRAPQMIGPPGTVKSGIDGVSVTYDYWSQIWRVYFVAPNGHIMETSYTGGPWWSGGHDLGAISTSAPAAVLRRSSGQINVFFRGTNGHLFDEWFDGASWHAPWDHGIAMVGDPAATHSPDDSLIEVFFNPFAFWIFGPPQLESQTWTSVYGWGGAATHGVVVGGPGPSRADDVFGVNPSGHLVEARPSSL